MAAPRSPGKTMSRKIGAADTELLGHIGSRVFRQVRIGVGEEAAGRVELQLSRQAQPRRCGLGVHEVNVGERQAPVPSQSLAGHAPTHPLLQSEAKVSIGSARRVNLGSSFP